MRSMDELYEMVQKALDKANDTAEKATEAINLVASSMEEMLEALETLADTTDEQPKSQSSAENLIGNPISSQMPPISGEEYPEYTHVMQLLTEEGHDDPFFPVMHIAPIRDLYPHELTCKVCWCNPTAELAQNNSVLMVKHNAADGRDNPEEDAKKSIN